MKKIFYKIFLILVIVTYMPLFIIYGFHTLYVNDYIKNEKAKELKEITEFVNVNSFSDEYKRKIEETENIQVDIVDLSIDRPETYVFEYLNNRDLKIDLESMRINQIAVRYVKKTHLLNNIYIIKKVDKEKYILISSLMVIPEVINRIILSAYFFIYGYANLPVAKEIFLFLSSDFFSSNASVTSTSKSRNIPTPFSNWRYPSYLSSSGSSLPARRYHSSLA